MILGIDHIGLATDDPAGVEPFLALLGLRPGESGPAEAYGVRCDFWQSTGAAVELVSPADERSAVSQYLAAHGPGLYHLAFEVDDLRAEVDRLRAAGLISLDPEPRTGARPGMTVSFLYLRKPAGLLIELVEYAPVNRKAGVPDVR